MARRPDLGYYDEGADLADAAFLAAGAALPPVAYRSLHFSYLEDEVIWSNGWVAIGTTHLIPNAGDILPYTAGYHGIHVQRQDDGSLIGRFNMAQHGGCRVVPAQCQNGAKTNCSFTSCGYSRDRGPISRHEEEETPRLSHQYLGLRPERLNPVAVRTLGPVVFVNLDPDAKASVLDLPIPFPRSAVHSDWIEVAANWKFVAEALAQDNGMERDGWRESEARFADGAAYTATWGFPNLIALRDDAGLCLIVLQPTALGKTMMRVEILAHSAAGDHARWTAELTRAAHRATALQTTLVADTRPASDAARWMQHHITARVSAMPKVDLDLPLSQPIRSYMR